MFTFRTVTQMIRTGLRLVNTQKVPVYTSSVTKKEYIKMLDIPTGRFQYVEIDGALTFRTETSRSYPLPPQVEAILEEGFFSEETAFEHRDREDRRALTLRLISEVVRAAAKAA